jgi:uncharacterized protein (TIGR02145 family)
VTATPTSSAPAKRKSSSVIIVTGTSSPILLTGLSFGINYIFSVLATNAVGGSPPITTTTTVTPCILNTAAASTNQTLVVNTALTNIMIATMGATGISNAGVSGSNSLPAGVSATFANNTITISGTPTASGTFSYSIPLTGGCGSVDATGTITVNAASLATLTTTAVSVVTDIGASSGGNITADGGAAITAKGVVWSTSTLPTVSLSTKTTDGTGTGIFTSTISGLTASTKYYVRSYATNTSGTSYGSELDFTTCTLNTAAASTNQTLVVNTALTNIMIATMGATGISNAGVSGSNSLPAWVSATWANNMITISGTPTATGTFNYSIPLTGGCGSVNATGTITVTAAPSFTCGTSTIADYNNINTYTTVSIGTQCWMKENLRTRLYNDGTEIMFDNSGGTGGTTSQTWYNFNGAYTIYANDSTPTTGNLAIYGYLYNWFAAAGFPTFPGNFIPTKNICPEGWHVPTDSDWNKLVKYLDSGADTTSNPTQSTTAGGYLKSEGNTYWTSQSTGTDNSSGFSAIPGGSRNNDGSFNNIRNHAFFWSATAADYLQLVAFHRKLSFNDGNVERDYVEMVDGASIRCLRD